MKLNKLLLALAASGIATSAFATNGYFSHGNGMTAKGMGGAATAMTKDAFGGANNPAAMVWVGNRYDVGADVFMPVRAASATSGATVTSSDNELFVIPEFGYNKMQNDKMSFGVTVYGNGGMNTDYPAPSGTNMLGGAGALGVDLIQLIVAPTVSYKVNESTSVGLSPLLGYQRFEAYGLSAFGVSNQGTDDASGFGARVGVLSKLNSQLTLGAAYSTKVDMSKFDKYAGLFAEQGDFDLPANWNIGLSFQPDDKLTVAVDFQRIEYSGVRAVNNPSANFLTAGLGGNASAGFGWSDVDVVKLGVEYKYSPKMILRAGYSHANAPMTGADVTFNLLAPAVIEDHITLGMTYAMDKDSDLTVSYAHAVENTISGSYLLNVAANPVTSYTGTIKMHQNSIGVAYSKKF